MCAHPHLVHNMTDIVMLFPLISRICIVLRQLRLAVAEAIGYTVHLLSTTQLDGQLAKLMPAIAQLYRKHQDHYYISQVCTYVRTSVVYSWMTCFSLQCLCMVVDAACKKQCDSFLILLDNLMVMLHQHVSGYCV